MNETVRSRYIGEGKEKKGGGVQYFQQLMSLQPLICYYFPRMVKAGQCTLPNINAALVPPGGRKPVITAA